MHRGIVVLMACLVAIAALTAVSADTRHSMSPVAVSACLPPDLEFPEGKSRWDLTSLVLADPADEAVSVTGWRQWVDPAGGDAVDRWLHPDRHRSDLQLGAQQTLDLIERTDRGEETVRLRTRTVGIGWVHLPSGPREAVVQRAVLYRSDSTGRYVPDAMIHRWVDPRAGVVAEVSGPAAEDGKSRLYVDDAAVMENAADSAADLTIYADELSQGPLTTLNYAWDRGEATPVSSLISNASVTTIGELIALDEWDFSGNNSGTELAQLSVPLDSSETCNMRSCGYFPGDELGRQDRDFDNANYEKWNEVSERVDHAGGVTVWLRAGAQREGKEGLFGDGESRFCYTDKYVCQDDTSVYCRNALGNQDCIDAGLSGPCVFDEDLTEVPLWDFTHQDGNGWYLQPGDSWESGVFNCEQNIYNQVCSEPGIFFDELWAQPCGDHLGKQSGEVLKGGVVTLPSGHTLNALLVRTVADFCVYTVSSCNFLFKVDEVRTVVYLWQVPYLGTVVLLQSPQEVPDLTSFTTVDATHVTFGLYPPLTLQSTGSTNDSVDLSWDPGADAHRISDYRVYWDEDSGASSEYAYDSVSDPGQVTFGGTTATVSGLTECTNHYFTVTSRSQYTNPDTSEVLTFESLVFPTQVSGDPDYVYPIEILAGTTGAPQVEAQNLVVDKYDPGGEGAIEICWDALADAPCLVGYDVLGASSPEAEENFSTVDQTGLVTCWTGNPSESYFIVAGRGDGGQGRWGHFGR